MSYSLLKALHVISVIAWMATTLYLGRLCVYFVEAGSKSDSEKSILRSQYAIMMRRLMYGIGHPSMLLTVVFGTWIMVVFNLFAQPWFHLKLTLVLLFLGYYIYLGRVARNLMSAKKEYTALYLRVLNEVATAFLIAVVVVVYLKSELSPINGLIVFLGTLIALIGVVYLMNTTPSKSK